MPKPAIQLALRPSMKPSRKPKPTESRPRSRTSSERSNEERPGRREPRIKLVRSSGTRLRDRSSSRVRSVRSSRPISPMSMVLIRRVDSWELSEVSFHNFTMFWRKL